MMKEEKYSVFMCDTYMSNILDIENIFLKSRKNYGNPDLNSGEDWHYLHYYSLEEMFLGYIYFLKKGYRCNILQQDKSKISRKWFSGDPNESIEKQEDIFSYCSPFYNVLRITVIEKYYKEFQDDLKEFGKENMFKMIYHTKFDDYGRWIQ